MTADYIIMMHRLGGVTLTHPDGTKIYTRPGDDSEYLLDTLGLNPHDWNPGDWDYLTDLQASVASEYFTQEV